MVELPGAAPGGRVSAVATPVPPVSPRASVPASSAGVTASASEAATVGILVGEVSGLGPRPPGIWSLSMLAVSPGGSSLPSSYLGDAFAHPRGSSVPGWGPLPLTVPVTAWLHLCPLVSVRQRCRGHFCQQHFCKLGIGLLSGEDRVRTPALEHAGKMLVRLVRGQ